MFKIILSKDSIYIRNPLAVELQSRSILPTDYKFNHS